MRLCELNQPNKEITQSYMNYMFKALKSALDDYHKDGTPKLNADGTAKKRAKPLSPEYGERRALRGEPDNGSPTSVSGRKLGPIIGSGGDMHSPISPSDAAKELTSIKSKMDAGVLPPYNRLKDQSDSFDAVTMRGKRSAPGRPALWPNGAKWDSDGPYYGMNRTVISPDGTRRVTRNRPAPTTKPGVAKTARSKMATHQRQRDELERLGKTRERTSKMRVGYGKKAHFFSGIQYSSTIDETLDNSLNIALGL